mgnify:CR=1 FL=1
MFKKGVITDEISQEFQVAVDMAREFNLDAVEIRSVWEKGPHELDKDDMKRIKDILKGTGLAVCGIGAPFFKCDIDNEEEYKEHIQILKNCIELAKELETNIIRGFTFWKKGTLEENLDRIIAKFEEPVKLMEAADMILAIEFDPSVFATNAKQVAVVLDKIKSPNVKGLWDPGNDIYDPDGEVPFPDGYKYMKDYMVHMHLKDARKNPQTGKIEGVPVGEGDVDYIEHFKQLIADGYTGYVSLETHYRPKHEISDELLALPKGGAFSYGGDIATRECLKKWFALLDKIA